MTPSAFLDDQGRLLCPVCKIPFNHIKAVYHSPESEDAVIRFVCEREPGHHIWELKLTQHEGPVFVTVEKVE